jgi:hypothetical protein
MKIALNIFIVLACLIGGAASFLMPLNLDVRIGEGGLSAYEAEYNAGYEKMQKMEDEVSKDVESVKGTTKKIFKDKDGPLSPMRLKTTYALCYLTGIFAVILMIILFAKKKLLNYAAFGVIGVALTLYLVTPSIKAGILSTDPKDIASFILVTLAVGGGLALAKARFNNKEMA